MTALLDNQNSAVHGAGGSLARVAETAAFLASDRAGAIVNATCGLVAGG